MSSPPARDFEKHWHPIAEIGEYLIETYKLAMPGKKVLEIGPGPTPFRVATHFVDMVNFELPGEVHLCDINTSKLPFPDKYFDFVYCRHVVEDIQNPDFACHEISRVSSAGYIETPSPLVELSRWVDAGNAPFRGYMHHRYIVWSTDNTLTLIPKFPVVEYLNFPWNEDKIIELLGDPYNWNSYFLWGNAVSVRMLHPLVDFKLGGNYRDVLYGAAEMALANAHQFQNKVTT